MNKNAKTALIIVIAAAAVVVVLWFALNTSKTKDAAPSPSAANAGTAPSCRQSIAASSSAVKRFVFIVFISMPLSFITTARRRKSGPPPSVCPPHGQYTGLTG